MALTKELCELIRQQATLEDSAAKCHIGRETIWEWRTRGQQNEHPCYVAFEEAIGEALIDAKQTLIVGIATDRDIKGKLFLLKNRYPAEYRDRIVQEVSGPDGSPLLATENSFNVVLELNLPEGVPVPENKSFAIETKGGQHDGERWQWDGDSRPPWERGNGGQ